MDEKYYIDSASEKLLNLAKSSGQLSDDKIFNLKANMALSKLSEHCNLKVWLVLKFKNNPRFDWFKEYKTH